MNFYITPWHWIGFSLILFCVELFVGTPGVSLLWLAFASFALSIVISSITINFWVQLGLLAVLSVIFAWLGKLLFKEDHAKPSSLNQPGQRLVNTRLTLQTPHQKWTIPRAHSRLHLERRRTGPSRRNKSHRHRGKW